LNEKATDIYPFAQNLILPASQDDNIEEARRNLIEALELFFETADPSEVKNRLHTNY